MDTMSSPPFPILVGCDALTDSSTPAEKARSPYDLMAAAARGAFSDTQSPTIHQAIDTVAVLRSYADTSHRFATVLGGSDNPPQSVAQRLGLSPTRHIYTWNGGNMPQTLVNLFSEQIVRGEVKAVLITGGEALRTQYGLQKQGETRPLWSESPGGHPELIGDARRGWNDHEDRHGLRAAIAQYPLFEQAFRGRRDRTPQAHLESNARLMASFAAVAAANPLATRREGWDAQRLATIDEENRWIGYPYPRLMVSNAFIDQAAALVLTSTTVAQEHGIPREKWVYLHGCADAHDEWYTSHRPDLSASPAMRAASRLAFDMAGKTIADMDFLDLYSCFPSAIEIACQELGLCEEDPRGLTVTGGLVYYGGPGNSYVVMSLCEMMRRLRRASGSFGLVSGNGNWVTKHSYGIYSTMPPASPWEREDPARVQAELDRLPAAPFTEQANGHAKVETYSIMHDRKGPSHAIILGRLTDSGYRFIANTPSDRYTLEELQSRDSLHLPGFVTHRDGLNTFTPSWKTA